MALEACGWIYSKVDNVGILDEVRCAVCDRKLGMAMKHYIVMEFEKSPITKLAILPISNWKLKYYCTKHISTRE